ncbi:MAG: Cache 3/Cache 2 fusion domain-containing protein [Methanomicrobiales archaeon]
MSISDKFKGMKMGTKILIICLVLVIVPTSLLGVVAYTSSAAAITDQVDDSLTTQIMDVDRMADNTYQLAQESLDAELSTLRYIFNSKGTPAIVDGQLVLQSGGGDYVVNDNYEIVDQITQMTGSKATIFQKVGGQAVRVSTNVIGPDGTRAVGTVVSQPVYDAVVTRGETFYGTADVVGTTYVTAYEPIRSQNGEIIGILFVGVTQDALFGPLKEEVSAITLGDTGYIYIMDTSGTLIVHPTKEGENLAQQLPAAQDMIDNREEAINEPQKVTYMWEGAEATAFYMYNPELDWIIASRVNPSEFMGPVDGIRNAIIGILAGSIIVGALISILFGRSISRRMEKLVALGRKVKEGELDSAARDLDDDDDDGDGGDEIGQVSRAFGGVVHTIQEFKGELATLSTATGEGQLDVRGDSTRFQGDYALLIQGLNETLDAVIGPLNVAAEYIDRISAGDIPERITDDYRGDFNEIKNNLNQCIDAVNLLVADAAMLAEAGVEGRLDTRADATRHRGDFRQVVEGINNTLDAVIGPLNVAAEYIDRISAGDIPERITDDYRGDFNEIKNNLNQCIDGLQGLVEANRSLQRMAVNDHTLRMSADYQGLFAEVAEAVNSVQDRVNHIAGSIEKISHGDLSELDEYSAIGRRSEQDRIVPGFVKTLETLNTLVDDANKLAEAGVNGQLDTRADASRHEGAYERVITGINNTLDAVVGPLHEAMRVSNEYADGDFTARMDPNLDVKGDFKAFKESLDNIGIKVSEALDLVSQQVTELGGSAEEANASVEEVSAGSSQLAKTSGAVSENADRSLDGISQVLKAMEDLSRTIQEVASRAEQVTTLVGETDEVGKNGMALAQKTEDGMNSITSSSNEVNTIILEIKSQMDRIGEIVNLITEIANQTNLLALNAAIEAARAGDAGRGFAVVATEVKSLAEESRTSAESIAEMIGNLQKQTQKAVETVEVSNREVQEGSGALQETLGAFTRIAESIDVISRNVSEVAAAAEEQSATVEEVTASMNEVNSLVENTAKEANDAAAVSEESAAAIDQISEVVNNVNTIVAKVSGEISKFRT